MEALIVGEALLEVYLHAAHVAPEVINELLDRRDTMLRSLAADESYSLRALAAGLRDAAQSANDLEVALVGALRALGFSTRTLGAREHRMDLRNTSYMESKKGISRSKRRVLRMCRVCRSSISQGYDRITKS